MGQHLFLFARTLFTGIYIRSLSGTTPHVVTTTQKSVCVLLHRSLWRGGNYYFLGSPRPAARLKTLFDFSSLAPKLLPYQLLPEAQSNLRYLPIHCCAILLKARSRAGEKIVTKFTEEVDKKLLRMLTTYTRIRLQ